MHVFNDFKSRFLRHVNKGRSILFIYCANIFILAPPPASTQPILGTPCLDDSGEANNTKKFFYRPCHIADFNKINDDHPMLANKIVFVFQV